MSMASHVLHPLLFSFFASIYLLSWIEATKNSGITIDLIHRDSPLSPSYNSSKTRFERLRSAFERSFSRVSSFKYLSSVRTTSTSQNDLEAPLTPDSGEYLMEMGIGSPPFKFVGIADTGSDLTWLQCQPCMYCYKQKAPFFDPKKSRTYRTVSCQAQQCSQVGSSCGNRSVCHYQYSYGDNSYTFGDLSVETFTFFNSTTSTFPKVVFGCGHENGGTFSDTGSGIIGLGGGPLSLINQLNQSIGGKFSYCLTLFNSNVTSKISFGANAVVAGPNVVSTPMVKKDPTFYSLTLEGISVGTNRVNYKPDSSNASVDEGNIIIDSGTTLTFLPSSIYGGLESAFIEVVKGKRVPDSQGSFNLCYQKSSNFSAPPVIAHFAGADVELPHGSTFMEVEAGVVCLTLLPAVDYWGILGNLHQMNYEIGYDIGAQKVNFLQTDCSKSQ